MCTQYKYNLVWNFNVLEECIQFTHRYTKDKEITWNQIYSIVGIVKCRSHPRKLALTAKGNIAFLQIECPRCT